MRWLSAQLVAMYAAACLALLRLLLSVRSVAAVCLLFKVCAAALCI